MAVNRRALAIGVVTLVALAAIGIVTTLHRPAYAAAAAASDEDTLWQNELAIYAGRGRGDLSFYVNHADPDFTAWPPQVALPFDYHQLVTNARQVTGKPGEKLVLEKNLIHIGRGGTIAMVYYTTHRTQRASGAAVNESFENIHVWVKEDSGWRIIGGMSRPVPSNRENLDTLTPPVAAPKP